MKARLFATVTAVLAATIAVPAWADCAYPKAPDSAPNGATATEAEMMAAMTALKKFDTEIKTYLDCLESETKTRINEVGDQPEQVKQIQSMSDKRHDAAFDELQTRATEFNTQLRAYKNKGKGKS